MYRQRSFTFYGCSVWKRSKVPRIPLTFPASLGHLRRRDALSYKLEMRERLPPRPITTDYLIKCKYSKMTCHQTFCNTKKERIGRVFIYRLYTAFSLKALRHGSHSFTCNYNMPAFTSAECDGEHLIAAHQGLLSPLNRDTKLDAFFPPFPLEV